MNVKKAVKKLTMGAISSLYTRDSHIWLLGEWYGNRCCDNCAYFANYLVSAKPELTVFFATNKDTDTSVLDERVHVIIRGSEEAIKVYKMAGVVIMNQSITDFSDDTLRYFSGAVTVNLWHGVPWKKIFTDALRNDNKAKLAKTKYVFNKTKAKVFLATSEKLAKIIRESAGIKDGRIIRAGYPRNNPFYDEDYKARSYKAVVSTIEQVSGKKVDEGAKIICYMPTFRDSGSEVFSFTEVTDRKFIDYLHSNDIYIVQKMHYAAGKSNDKASDDHIINVSDYDTPALMAASSMLVTDYSSCFFDYLMLDRPIVHYIYDYEYYSTKDRGLYYDKDEVLCGDFATELPDLFDKIMENMEEPGKHKELRAKRREEFMTYESSDSCSKIYDHIIKMINEQEAI